MKTPEQLLGDYQWNLYQWDEYSKHEAFLPSRWVYFASQETPQARAVDVQLKDIDPERVKSICTQLADRANVLRGYIRGWRASTDRAAFTASLPKNVTNCNAFGRLCPYHVRSPGGTCAGGDDQVIPVGQLLSSPNARPIKSVSVGVFEPGAFQFTSDSLGANTDMSIRDQINQQLAQQQTAPQGAPPPGYAPQPAPNGYAPAQGYGPPPAPAAFVPQGQPPQGAPPSGFAGAPFAPAPGQPGYAPGPGTDPRQPAHVGPPEGQAQAWGPPAQAVASAPPVAPAVQRPAVPAGFGQQNGSPDHWTDGANGWLDRTNFPAACAYYGLDPNTFPNFAPAQAPSPGAPGVQASAPQGTLPGGANVSSIEQAGAEIAPESADDENADLAAVGALTVALFQAVLGLLGYGKTGAAGETPKRKAGRPKKSA